MLLPALSGGSPVPRPDGVTGYGGPVTGVHRGAEPDAPCRRTLVGVAHQDDDLLFVNPETARLVRAGCFAGTVYLTAGDAGRPYAGDSYVGRRELGVRAAYARMAGLPDRWRRDDIAVRGRGIASFVLAGRPDVRLVFLRLPDGLPNGAGSVRHSRQSLLKLVRGQIAAIGPVDDAAPYTVEELTSVLSEVIALRRAERVLTLDYDSAGSGTGPPYPADHSDHEMAGRLVRKAAFRSPARPEVSAYVGYGVSNLPANLTASQRRDKLTLYQTYAALVGCSTAPCPAGGEPGPTYRSWLRREHHRPHRQPAPGEIMTAISRTDARTTVERCLAHGAGRGGTDAVTTADCDGTAAQRWSYRGGALRNATTGRCLTAAASLTLSTCDGRSDQRWWRDASGRIGTAHGCLHQDDLAALAPGLALRPCDPFQPEVMWRW